LRAASALSESGSARLALRDTLALFFGLRQSDVINVIYRYAMGEGADAIATGCHGPRPRVLIQATGNNECRKDGGLLPVRAG
jgi:hypothetical protein